MKALLFAFFALAMTDIAVGEEMGPPAEITLEASVVPSPEPASPASALADCVQQTVHDITPVALIAAYPTILVVLRILSEALGKLAAKGSNTASTAVAVIRWLMAALGWLLGKGGMGTPSSEIVKTLPSLKAMKEAAKKKKAAKAKA